MAYINNQASLPLRDSAGTSAEPSEPEPDSGRHLPALNVRRAKRDSVQVVPKVTATGGSAALSGVSGRQLGSGNELQLSRSSGATWLPLTALGDSAEYTALLASVFK